MKYLIRFLVHFKYDDYDYTYVVQNFTSDEL